MSPLEEIKNRFKAAKEQERLEDQKHLKELSIRIFGDLTSDIEEIRWLNDGKCSFVVKFKDHESIICLIHQGEKSIKYDFALLDDYTFSYHASWNTSFPEVLIKAETKKLSKLRSFFKLLSQSFECDDMI